MTPFFARLRFAFRTFFAILFHDHLPSDVVTALGASVTREPPPAPSSRLDPTATQLLALLQRDGRLVDFLMEDITPYGDAQIGSAVRTVHTGCRQALQQYVSLAPAFEGQEGERVSVTADVIDAAKVKLLGNVSGAPPFRGVLRHRGWIVDRIELPPLPSTGPLVVAPAEVEVV